MMTKKNAPYSSNRRKANQQVAESFAAKARRWVGMETPSEKEKAPAPPPKPKADPNKAADQFGGMLGDTVTKIRARKKADEDAMNAR
jgi:hypothetical protein